LSQTQVFFPLLIYMSRDEANEVNKAWTVFWASWIQPTPLHPIQSSHFWSSLVSHLSFIPRCSKFVKIIRKERVRTHTHTHTHTHIIGIRIRDPSAGAAHDTHFRSRVHW